MPSDATTDEELMSRLQTGEDHALDELMERWQVPIRRYLYRCLQNDATALDVAEDVFVKVYQHRDRFVPDSCFKSWIFTIATNLARNHYRWRRRHPTEPLSDSQGAHQTVPSALREEETPSETLRQRERAEAVRCAIASLPEELKTVTLLFEYENLSHAEIAGTLHCSPKAVEMRLYRARKQLRAVLAPYFADTLAT